MNVEYDMKYNILNLLNLEYDKIKHLECGT